jgi:hypothetical protein
VSTKINLTKAAFFPPDCKISSHGSVVFVKTDKLAKKIEIEAQTDYAVILKVNLIKGTM